jgi:putative phosphoribosyl transferase
MTIVLAAEGWAVPDGTGAPGIRRAALPAAMELETDVEVLAGHVRLAGHIAVPRDASATVLFVHGSGSSRFSPRNRYVASVLNEAGLATLLFDLLTRDEDVDRSKVFDVALLAGRLREVTTWLREGYPRSAGRVGYFGASTGSGAALWAAAEDDAEEIGAIVSRGGRPDLALPRLARVRAPTLLIVGGHDDQVLALNREALGHLRCPTRLVVVPGAGHLFEEAGALEAVAAHAADWFSRWLLEGGRPAGRS